MTSIRLLSLRWRLILAFLLVSAPPVLVASYIAAEAISVAFERNVERWLEETARFLAGDADETKIEADKSAAIIAAALSNRNGIDPGRFEHFVHPFADLLASVGYDYVQIYREDGVREYTFGQIDFVDAPPQDSRKSLYRVRVNGRDALIGGAARAVDIAGKQYFVFVANLIDEAFFNSSQASKSLDIKIFQVGPNGPAIMRKNGVKDQVSVPESVYRALMRGAPSAISSSNAQDRLATAFAALRDDQGRLVGIVACRVAGMTAVFENLSEWQYFLALAGVAGFFSVLVGALIAQRISQPVQALTLGLRAVATGDYLGRVREEGGRELAELAAGFNLMSEQLERLRNMEGEMRRREQLAALGEAAAVIAHEIRNPLGIIKTSSQVVRMKSALKPSEDRLIGFVLDEVSRIDRLVQEILDFVRPKELHKRRIELMKEVVERVVEFTAPELAKRGLTCAVLGRNTGAVVLGDPDRLYQALLNLILNAMDATSKGGHLTVIMSLQPECLELRVEDDGIGMPEDVVRRVFDPFFTTKARGTGLGLAQAKAVIEDHAGTISCVSEPGHGTTFVVCLPYLIMENLDEAVCSGR
ncbi:sensor histidine kinase [Microvirga alba]|uniref:histidine kinase n=1 Tax=Microvirga alba TaxID=2791025 RepID=A0A931BWS2_9HYPH|nr:sensor histidine kinase [Microvirga alba]MBF9235270.1 HAMP domain-containing protein [Microvirga alba]